MNDQLELGLLDSAIEQESSPASAASAYRLLLRSGKEYVPTEASIEQYQIEYPTINVRTEFRNMEEWLEDHASRRKTAKGIRRFIRGWLSRHADDIASRGRSVFSTTGKVYVAEGDASNW